MAHSRTRPIDTRGFDRKGTEMTRRTSLILLVATTIRGAPGLARYATVRRGLGSLPG